MRTHTLVPGLLVGALWLLLAGAQALPQQAAAGPTADQLDADIRLLGMINRLELTQPQIDRLLSTIRDIRARQEALEKARNSPEIIRILTEVRQALLEGKSQQDVEPLQRQLEQHVQRIEQEEGAFGEARDRAARFAVQALTPEQQQRLLEPLEEETFFGVLSAMGQARVVAPEDWSNWLNGASRSLGLRAAKGDRQAAEGAAAEIRQLLEEARTMTEPQLTAQSEQLSGRVEQILERAGANPSPVWLGNVKRDMMADLIFAERAQIVLEDKLKQLTGGG